MLQQTESFVPLNEVERRIFDRMVPVDDRFRRLEQAVDFERFRPILAASYAATFGSRVRAGVTYKFLQDRQDCSGDCTGAPTHVPSTSAFDFGVQAALDDSSRITFGAYARNIGFRLQINDVEQQVGREQVARKRRGAFRVGHGTLSQTVAMRRG